MWRIFLIPGLLFGLVMVLGFRLTASSPDRWSLLLALVVVYLVWLLLWFVPLIKRWFRDRFIP